MAKHDLIRDAWASLGVAFAFEAEAPLHADPERTLLSSLREFDKDRKLFRLVLAWLEEYGDLIHVERLKSLSDDLTPFEVAWLGGIASIMFWGRGDSRFKALLRHLEERHGRPGPAFPTSELDATFIKRDGGSHPAFASFGLQLPKSQVIPSETKKIAPRTAALHKNLWLRLRALIGVNWRADVAAVMLLRLAEKPYQAQKRLGCSSETALRNWKALEEAGAQEALRSVAS